jgi:hypothetical protein
MEPSHLDPFGMIDLGWLRLKTDGDGNLPNRGIDRITEP